MPKSRKVISPARDLDSDALKNRLASFSNEVGTTPITPSSDTAKTPPRTISERKKPHTASAKPTNKPVTPKTTVKALTHKVDGQLRVSAKLDARLRDFCSSRNLPSSRLVSAALDDAKKLLTEEHVRSLKHIVRDATANFDQMPSVSLKRYNYSVASEVIDRCHELSSDVFRRAPAKAYAACLSAVFVHCVDELMQ